MDVMESGLPKKAYLAELKGCLTSPFACFGERMTGIVIGSFFSVAYYSPREWNRRVSGECNRAWGRVKEVNGKTEICFLRGKGHLSPFWLMAFTLLFAVGLNAAVFTETGGAVSLADDLWMLWGLADDLWMLWGLAVIASVAVCGITAFQSSITDQGIAGAGEITRLLRDPGEYYC